MAPCQRRTGDATTGSVVVCRTIYGSEVLGTVAVAIDAIAGRHQMTNNTDRTMETGCFMSTRDAAKGEHHFSYEDWFGIIVIIALAALVALFWMSY